MQYPEVAQALNVESAGVPDIDNDEMELHLLTKLTCFRIISGDKNGIIILAQYFIQ